MSEPRCGNLVNGVFCRAETRYEEGGYNCRACGKRYITASSILRWIESRFGGIVAFYKRESKK